MKNKHLGLLLTLMSIGLFIPGISQPIFSLNMEMQANLGSSVLSSSIIDKELSIMATVEELWQEQRLLVAALIFVFSVLVPICKTCLVTIAYWKRTTEYERKIMRVISSIGKWSMADVFVVAVFLAFLSTNHADTANAQQLTVFGFRLDMIISSETLSAVGSGFYYFTGYCLLSLLGTQIYMCGDKQD